MIISTKMRTVYYPASAHRVANLTRGTKVGFPHTWQLREASLGSGLGNRSDIWLFSRLEEDHPASWAQR